MRDASPPLPPRSKRVLLIGWEGADWLLMERLVDAGQMPHLAEMTERGIMGNLRSSVPMVCPILWTSGLFVFFELFQDFKPVHLRHHNIK